MTTETRTLVWNEKFLADMRQRYFGHLAARYRRLDNTIHITLLVLSGATVSSANELLLPPQYTATLALTAFVVAAAATVLRLSQRSSSFVEFSVDWGKLHNEYAMLWDDLNSGSMESAAVRQRVQELRNRAELIDRRSTPLRRQAQGAPRVLSGNRQGRRDMTDIQRGDSHPPAPEAPPPPPEPSAPPPAKK